MDWNPARVQIKRDFLRIGCATQCKRSPQGGMASESQFFLNREDTHADTAIFFQRRLTRQNERGFRKVHLPCYGLHFRVGESPAIEKNRQWIAGKTLPGKHVPLRETQPP